MTTITTTGADFKRYYNDETAWPEGAFHEDVLIHVDKVSEAVLERLPPERRPAGCPVLEINTRALALDVPFAEKDAAKAAGARWHGGERRWCIDPAHREDVQQWLPVQETWISLVPPAEDDFEEPAAVRALRMP